MEIKGDLLKSHCDIIAHQSNCLMGFGSGVAGQIRKQLVGAYDSFKKDNRTPEEKLGTFSVATEDVGDFLAVYNLYGQMYYGGEKGKIYTDYEALESAISLMLKDIFRTYKSPKKLTIGFPSKIGCGLAGGDWEIVSKMIERVFDEFGAKYCFYEYTP